MKCLITSATLMGGKWILEKYPNLNNYQLSIDECFIYNYIFDSFYTQDVIIVEINDLCQLIDDFKEGVIILSRENDGFEYDDLFEKHNIKYHIIIYDDYIE